MLDLIQRYKAVIDELLLDRKIIDIGGGSESIAPFVRKKLDITSCDVSFRGEQIVKTVKCSADKLSFKDGVFDFPS